MHLVNSGENNEKVKTDRYMKIMRQNCYRLIRLVDNIMDSTKINSEFYEMNMKNYNIVEMLENITMAVGEYTKDQRINLVFDTEIEEKRIACDAAKIERIMLNILANAVKFTEEQGTIRVNVYAQGEKVVVKIKDNGIGIRQEDFNTIFDRFKQADKSLRRNHEGSGIGLSLVKAFTEMHEGKVYVVSEYGKGSEFIVELPNKVVGEDISENVEKHDKQRMINKINLEFSDIYYDNVK